MKINAQTKLIQELTATAEVMGATLTGPALAMMAEDFADVPIEVIIAALAKLRRSKNRFTIAAILELIQAADGRVTADQAWALIPKNEDDSAVVTQEIIEAWAASCDLYSDGDKVGAHIAFQREYARLVAEARDRGDPVAWFPTLGASKPGRAGVMIDAVLKNRISLRQAMGLLDDDGQVQIAEAAVNAGLMTHDAKQERIPKPAKIARIEKKKSGMTSMRNHTDNLRKMISADER